MIASVECLPCLIRQAIDTVQRLEAPPPAQQELLREVLRLLSAADLQHPPPVLAQRIHQLIRTRLDDDDPFRAIKANSNALALEWMPELRERLRMAEDPLAPAIRTAIAGNIIDYGVKSHVGRACIDATLSRTLTMELDAATLAAFRREVAEARSILYLADNAGEIIFDRLLIECLPLDRVTLVVRGAPILNDVTRDDARAAGLDALVAVIDNGTDIPGTVVDACTPEFQTRFARADVVISKGQGNFETLSDIPRPIYHLFVVKCPMVARATGCEMGTPVFRCMGVRAHGGVG